VTAKTAIDQSACTGCGKCVRVCPGSVLALEGTHASVARPHLCCSCGHCAAICPEGAVSCTAEDDRRAFSVAPFDEDLSPVERLLSGKRSVREFKDRPLDRDTITRLIEYAEKAPSSSNSRRRGYVVLTDPAGIDEVERAVTKSFARTLDLLSPAVVRGVDLLSPRLGGLLAASREDLLAMREAVAAGGRPIFRAAPCVVFVTGPRSGIQVADDCMIALQYLMLLAESQGIGSCVIGYAQHAHAAVERELPLAPGSRVYAAAILGYPKYTYQRQIRYNAAPDIVWQ
jgi:nitroreductase/NAD-dependent dihydropyrimidine dehydrogenase PreA subunit